MGPSGAGKSTLLHLIGMHDSAWTGEYLLFDHAVHKLKKKERDEIYKKYYSEANAAYGNRIIKIVDAWITND
jgi:ABC-type lipoprotein export system ATPase subunit